MPRKLPEGEGKRHGLSFRTTLDLQERLKQAAMKSGRSLAAEVELRLENSFQEQDRRESELKTNLISKALLGDSDNNDLIRIITAAVGAAIAYTGKHWRDDPYTRAAVRSAIEAVYTQHFEANRISFENDSFDRDRFLRAEKAGALYGKILVAPEQDRDVASYLADLLETDQTRAEAETEVKEFGKMSPERQNAALKEKYGIDLDTLNSFELP